MSLLDYLSALVGDDSGSNDPSGGVGPAPTTGGGATDWLSQLTGGSPDAFSASSNNPFSLDNSGSPSAADSGVAPNPNVWQGYANTGSAGGTGAAGDTSPWATLSSKAGSAWDSGKSWLDRLMKGDKGTLGQAKFGLGALGIIGSLLQNGRARNQLSPAQLQAMLKSPYSNWTPGQQQAFNAYFYQPLPKFNYQRPNTTPTVPPTGIVPVPGIQPGAPSGYARGGGVTRGRAGHGAGCPCAMCRGGALGMAAGGSPLVYGAEGGQSDKISARLSPGEYVMDADVVSALGDGNNAAGARQLDQMRQAIRTQKRGAPASRIPPTAKSPLEYLKGARRGT